MRPTILEVNLNVLNNNINEIKKMTNKEIMPVVKANGYGTHINQNNNFLNKFNIVAVATVYEGLIIRESKYKNKILVLNQPSIDEIENIIEEDLTIGLSSKEFIEECIRRDLSIKIHLEIETGMNRTGIKLDKLKEILELIDKSKLKLEGIYTHFSSADFDEKYTEKQINRFKEALKICNRNFKYIHTSASNGILNYKLDFTNTVRPGIIMYGYEPYKNALINTNIKPIAKLKTKITFIEEREIGDAISYSQKYICKEKRTIATIPIGYADGLRRNLTNNGEVVINNTKVPIVGTICMDSCMIDVTGLNAKVGDTVYIWDNDLIKLEEIAEKCNTINYEIISTIGRRVERIFIEE